MKNGTAVQKMQMQTLAGLEEKHSDVIQGQALDNLVIGIQQGSFSDTIELLTKVSELGLGVFSLLLDEGFDQDIQENALHQQEQKRRLKRKNKSLSR